jgi:hypothetical protein
VQITYASDVDSERIISDESDNPFTIQPAQITTADIELTATNYVVGVMGDVTVNFTTINSLPADGKIVITFPSGFILDSGGSTSASSSTIDGTFSVTTASNVVTVARNNDGSQTAAGSQILTLTNIQNPADTGTTGTYALKTTTSDDKTIDEATSIAGDTITNGGTLTYADVEPATRYAGVTESVTVQFTTVNPIPADGKIIIDFPDGFTLDSGAATTASSTTINGTLSVTTDAVNKIVTITRSAGTQQTPAVEVITLTNIQNPTSGGLTGTYQIQTTSSSGPSTGLIDQDSAVASDHIIGTLVSPSVTSSSYRAGATSDTTISFTTVSPIPVGGTIEVDFSDDYDLTGTLGVVSGNTGATVAASDQTLIITLGTQINAATSASIVISGIKNPQVLGSTGTAKTMPQALLPPCLMLSLTKELLRLIA